MLNIHLQCFAMRKDLLTEKRKRQVFILPEILVKRVGINKIKIYLSKETEVYILCEIVISKPLPYV